MKRFFGRFFMTLGILCLAAAAGLYAYNIWDAGRADQASQEILSALEEKMQEEGVDISSLQGQEASSEASSEENSSEAEYADEQIRELYELFPEMEMPTTEINGYRYVGVLQVPSYGLTLPVMEDWDMTRLKTSPCVYSGSVYRDNLVIAGHNYARHFSHLKWAPVGTEIIFTDVNGNVFHYVIDYTEVIQPTDIESMTAESDSWDLTLFTCTTGGQSRYTIRCRRTE